MKKKENEKEEGIEIKLDYAIKNMFIGRTKYYNPKWLKRM